MAISETVIDTEAVYTAIDRKRRHLRISRKEVAEILGVTPPSVTQWGQGSKMSADVLARVCVWLDTDLRAFVVPRPVLDAGAAVDVTVRRELTERRDEQLTPE